MSEATKKQKAVLTFISSRLNAGSICPTHREIAEHFKWSGPHAAARHLTALIKKGLLIAEPGKARALRVAEPFSSLRSAELAHIPFYGSIPAGFGDERTEEPDGCVSVDVATIGFKPTRNTFCLRVKGDSMIGRHICDGDIVVLEHGAEPRNGQIVAALIDRKSTLKTFVQKGGKKFLKAENPDYPNLIPSEELMIQGVFKALIRKD